MSIASFLAAARAVVGKDHVIESPDGLAPFARIMMPVPEAEHAPVGVVSPQSLAEVRALLRLAGEHKTPLWPTSTGKNFGYGTSTAATPGQVTLDLRRMNRVIDIDPVLCTALVEPGVTYKLLQDTIRAQGHKLWIDFPAPGPLVGPVGNSLERGNGTTPYGDHFANTCGFEVVLADGTVLRTGMGGVANTKSWQAFRYGYGPWLDGIFTQSNFGVVTKMGLWLMPAPPAWRSGMAVWDKFEDIGRIVDTLRPLRFDGTIGNCGTLLDSTLFAASTAKRADLYSGKGAIPPSVTLEYARSKGLGAWQYAFSVYGRPDRVASDWKVIETAVAASGGKLVPDAYDPMQVGELSLQTFSIFNWTGGHGLAWFSPVMPLRPTDAIRQVELARGVMDKHGVDFMTGMTLNGREGLNVMPMVFDRGDPDSTARHRACFEELIQAFGEAGYGFYRTGVGFMDQVARVHGETQMDVNRRLKRALDPHGIIAPGKSGIHL